MGDFLLTDDEIQNLYDGDFWRKVMGRGIGTALKAQAKKLFEEMPWHQDRLEAPKGIPPLPIRYITEGDWQALKKQLLEEKPPTSPIGYVDK